MRYALIALLAAAFLAGCSEGNVTKSQENELRDKMSQPVSGPADGRAQTEEPEVR